MGYEPIVSISTLRVPMDLGHEPLTLFMVVSKGKRLVKLI